MNTRSSIRQITSIFMILLLFSCSDPDSKHTVLQAGDWLFELQVDPSDPDRVLPFNAVVRDDGSLVIKNAGEEILVNEIRYFKDSVSIVLPVFGSEFEGKLSNNILQGHWIKYNVSPDYKIPFTASYGRSERFLTEEKPGINFTGRWKSFFIEDTDTVSAIGIFAQTGHRVTGTFLTETGDYRYLEGVATGNRVKISTFDGAHAFLFEAVANEQGTLNGTFRSGNSWESRWLASRDQNARLSDMKSLTYLKPGYEKLVFSFPDETGRRISLEADQFRNKVVIVQIFGTWCPNCMDETRYLVELYEKYNAQGLEVIGLDFEPKPTEAYFRSRIARFRKDLNVPYPLLLAGHSDKKKAAESLPMLNQIISYPTAIFIDRKGTIREIHTGFSGPGTGQGYEEYIRETEILVRQLLDE